MQQLGLSLQVSGATALDRLQAEIGTLNLHNHGTVTQGQNGPYRNGFPIENLVYPDLEQDRKNTTQSFPPSLSHLNSHAQSDLESTCPHFHCYVLPSPNVPAHKKHPNHDTNAFSVMEYQQGVSQMVTMTDL